MAKEVELSNKLSVGYCKKILERTGKKYTEEQINKIRHFLNTLAEIAYKSYRKKKDHEKGSNHLHQGINR